MTSPPTARSAALTNFKAMALARDLNPHQLISDVGLPWRCLDEPDLIVPAHAVVRVLEMAAEQSGDQAFGLRMATSRRLSNLGMLGLLVRDQPSLRHALDALVTHIHTHTEVFSVWVESLGDTVAIREETRIEGEHSTRQAVEAGMGTTFRILRLFLGDSWHPRQVHFRHESPTDTRWHQALFGCKVLFSQPTNSIICRASDLEAPNPGADPVMASYAEAILNQHSQASPSMSDRVRQLIIVLLPRGHCRIDVVAQHLGLDRRTIYSHLRQEGTAYSTLLNGMRQELLAQYMRDRHLALSEVATLLGFSELSAFSRWHRTQFGQTARDRKRQTHDSHS